MARNQIIHPSITHRVQRGAAAVEFAIVLVLMLLMVAGIVEIGRTFWYYDALIKATRDGARFLSVADKSTFSSATVDIARDRVVLAANAARVQPVLTTSNVAVTCLDAAFTDMGCAAAPANVRVAITGYTVDIGGIMPFFSPTGGSPTVLTGIPLSPRTTMRYMN